MRSGALLLLISAGCAAIALAAPIQRPETREARALGSAPVHLVKRDTENAEKRNIPLAHSISARSSTDMSQTIPSSMPTLPTSQQMLKNVMFGILGVFVFICIGVTGYACHKLMVHRAHEKAKAAAHDPENGGPLRPASQTAEPGSHELSVVNST